MEQRPRLMKALYVQPYVPAYRVPLFDRLGERLRTDGGGLTVASAAPMGLQSARCDAETGPWHTNVRSRSWSTPIGQLRHRSGLGKHLANADVVVMELDAGNLNAWLHLGARRHPPLVLWGHGRSFVSRSHPLTEALRRLLARTAAHVMTYSPAGRAHLIGKGVPAPRVTCVGNSTDTVRLRTLLDQRLRRPSHKSEAFDQSVIGRNVACYVGGLDGDKRVPFLVSAAQVAHSIDPSFLLLVAGSGTEQHLLRSAGEAIAWRPRASAADLADLAVVSRSIWMPGRVGLVAVDALALGRPVLTTAFPFHAPEFEFLTLGQTVHLLPDEPGEFARAALQVQSILSATPAPAAPEMPTIESVVDAMYGVLHAAARQDSPT